MLEMLRLAWCRRVAFALFLVGALLLAHGRNVVAAWTAVGIEQDADDTPAGDRSITPSAAEMVEALNKRAFVPLTARNGLFTTAPVTPLPDIVNGNFDGSGGWTQLQNDDPLNLVVETSQLGRLGLSTQPNLAWLGGGCSGCFPPTVAAVHRLIQTVQLPADYSVNLEMDYLIQSSESECGRDTAELFINGVLSNPLFSLCDASGHLTNTWFEASAGLTAYRGQSVTIEFRVSTNDTLNSNFYLDNIHLCGNTLRLPLADQCGPASWREAPLGSARGGGVSNSSGRSLEPAIGITGFNRPYLVWSDNTGGPAEILARRWNGVAWEPLWPGGAGTGNISNTPGQSASPALAVDTALTLETAPERVGQAWVAWHDATPGQNEIYIRRWSGTDWEEAGPGSASGGGVSNTAGESFGAAIAVGPDGRPYVAWTDATGGDYEIFAKYWTGTAWAEAGTHGASDGGISNNAGDSDNVALAVAPDGYVYAAWADRSAGDAEIYVKRWKVGQSAWQSVSAGSASDGGISNNDTASYAPSVGIGPDGVLFAAWIDRDATDTEIYAKRLVGTTWEEIGAGSATGGGVSRNSGPSLDPALAVGADGRPTIAWSDLSGANADILVRRWNGSAWTPVGTSSASFAGVSATWGFSATPALSVGPDAVPWVVWSDNSGGSSNPEIYLRRYMP